MIRYMFKELNTALNRRYAKVYIAGIFLICLIANISVVAFRAIYGAHEGTYGYNVMEYATWCFIIPYYTCIIISDIVFGKEYPNPRIKNSYTKNLGPTAIYLSKYFASLLLAVIFAIITAMVLIVITTVFHISDGAISPVVLADFGNKMLYALPLWIAGISFANMFLFIFKEKKKAYFGFFLLTLIIPRLLMIPAAEPFTIKAFKFVRDYLITQNFSLLPYPADPSRSIPRTIAVGLIYSLISDVVGIVYYSRQKK